MKNKDGLPLGFAMVLAQNPAAMERYSALSAEEKHALTARAHNAASKNEMQLIVNSIAEDNNYKN